MLIMKMLIILELFILIPKMEAYEQNDYSLTFERLSVVRFNKKIFKNAKITTFKYNRTQAAINATFDMEIDLGNNVEFVAQAYAFASNEYRLFPLRLGLNLCTCIKKNDFGLGEIAKYGNFPGCPLKKGIINVYNWKPNTSKFPPYIPNGQYRMEIEVLYFSEEAALVEAYGTVSRYLGRRH